MIEFPPAQAEAVQAFADAPACCALRHHIKYPPDQEPREPLPDNAATAPKKRKKK